MANGGASTIVRWVQKGGRDLGRKLVPNYV